jgi:tetratricopeptide (TPR) repeat protein
MGNAKEIDIQSLRKLLNKRMDIDELKVVWFYVFGEDLGNVLPNASAKEVIIKLISKTKQKEKWVKLYDVLIEECKDLKPALDPLLLSAKVSAENSATNPVHYVIPYRSNPFFTGRETELAKIDQALAKQGEAAIQALAGLGGIGKTATAIEYAHRHQEKYPNEHIFWIIADNNSNVVNSFNNIAKKLGFPLDEKQDEIIAKVKDWLEGCSNWLLIFDNLEDLIALTGYLPASAKGKVLITTQLANTRPFARIEIEKFSDADSVEFLFNCAEITAPTDEDKKSALQLARELDGLPLALEQAAAYIAENQLSIQEYLECYQEGRSALLAQPSHSSTHDTVTVTFKLSFDKLKETDPVAADLLQFMAFLAPDAIPEEIFKFIWEHLIENLPASQRAAASSLSWIKVYSAATRYSLIKRDATSKSFSIHRLVQLVIREMLAEDEQRQWLESVVTVLAAIASSQDLTKIENWPLCARLVPHQQMLFQHIQQYQLFNEASGAMLNQAGYYLQAQGQYQQAEPLMKEALEIRKQVLGTLHPAYATSLNNLAALYQSQGRYEQAEPLYLEDLKITKQVLGTNHPDYAKSLNNLALLYQSQGRYEQAEPLFQQALEIRKQVLGTNHPSYATSLNNLALLYESQGRYEQAEPLYQQALEIRKQLRDTNHPDYANSLNNLAGLYQSQGRYEQAEPLYQQALEIKKQVLGTNHPDYAKSLGNLARLYKSQGRYEQAEPLLKEVSEVFKQVQGTNHPDYATSLNNLAGLYQSQGRYEEAEPLMKEALEIKKQVLGTNHPDYATSLNNLAGLYDDQGRYEEAEPLYQQASEVYKQVLGTNHPSYATSLNNLAGLYESQGRYEEAEPLFQQALEIKKQVLGTQHPHYKLIARNLAALYRKLGRDAEAEKLDPKFLTN